MKARQPQPVQGPKMHTVGQVADYLQVAPTTVYRLIKAGRLRHCRVGASIRVTPSDLAAYLNAPPAPPKVERGPKTRPLHEETDPDKLIDMSRWQRLNDRMRVRKGIPAAVGAE